MIENTANSANAAGLLIKAGQNSQSVNNRLLSFAHPDGTEIGAVRQVGSSDVDFWSPSDRRLKTTFVPTRYGLSDLLKIEVQDYNYLDDPEKQTAGFVAQQLFEHYPEAVSPGGENAKTDPRMVNYGRVTPLLVKALQEQQAVIEDLKLHIERLETENIGQRQQITTNQ